jgi:hypothetical protein
MKRALLPLLVLLTVVLLFSGGQAWAQFIPSNHVSTTLEGCRNNGTITLPINGQFVCADAAYTTGNLGKGWNELDLVPHRLTTQVGTQATATTDFSVIVAGDYQTSGRVGWDVISVPTVNAVSDGSCSLTYVGPQSTEGTAQNPFGGGTDVAIYRQWNIHQNKGTTCVFDYVQRLSLGAHLWPGSSLQSYMFLSQDFSTGKKTISIPVNEVLPQSISKDMSATQGSDHTWTVSKDPSPATVSFSDTCNLSNPSSSGVQITVKWTKLAAVPGGPITVVTHVYATNPAARSITTNVTDEIYSGTTLLDTAGPTSTVVPANTANLLVLTHTTTVASGTTNLNDIATATYTDTVTGVPVPGNTQATASADVQLSGPEKNNSATVNDTESLGGGAGFLFSADSFTPAVGAFDSPYIAGTQTEGPVGWTSNSQTGSGQVTFNKTIYTSQGNANSAVLSDTATLNGVDGFTTDADASINISAHAFVALTINKTVTPAMPAGVSQTFTFHVFDAQQQEVASTTVTVSGGQSTGSASVKDLAPGTYTVTEDPVSGFTTDDPQSATITLPSCSGGVTFHNTRGAHLKLVKVVNNNHGGTAVATDFTLSATGPQTISGAGGAESDVDIGTYSLSETNVTGYTASNWSCVGGSQSGSSITLAAGDNATCTITNSDQPAHLKLVKVVVNDDGGTAKTTDFTLSAAGPTPISGAGGAESDVDAGSYNLSETNLAGYTAGSWSCVGGTQNGSSVSLAIGQSATCTITNDDQKAHLTLIKTVINDNGGTKVVSDFALFISGTSATSGVKYDLNAGTYTASETQLYGYTASAWGGDCAANGSITLKPGDDKTCTITNNDLPGTLIVRKIVKAGISGMFTFNTTGTGYNSFTIPGGSQNSQTLNVGTYTVKELVPLGWTLTGIGGSTDPNAPYACTVTGSGGSSGMGDLNTQTATVSLKNGDTVTCVFENTGVGATRTQGFWATHPQLANIAWFGGTGYGHTFPGVAAGMGDTSVCGRPLDLTAVMGGFWSSIPMKSTGAKRLQIDQLRMQLLQQLLAAELNMSAFGTVPPGGIATLQSWENALCGTNSSAIRNAQQQAGAFNSLGDNSTFTPGTSADAKTARSVANIPFWDIIKP